jgi:hypothetical protein
VGARWWRTCDETVLGVKRMLAVRCETSLSVGVCKCCDKKWEFKSECDRINRSKELASEQKDITHSISDLTSKISVCWEIDVSC